MSIRFMKHTISACLFILFAASAALACEGDSVAKLFGVAVTRCTHRVVTLSFDRPGVRKRLFVTIDDADARRLYETLRVYYERPVKP